MTRSINPINDLSQSWGVCRTADDEVMVYVFRTNVSRVDHARTVTEILENCCKSPEITFDLEDCDKVLRVERPDIPASEIIDLLHQQGFDCEELNG